jgi:outer membrane immunogenic protein
MSPILGATLNKIAACVAAIAALIAAPAFAADMAVKALPPAPAPIYSWTGWYVGANVGDGWGHHRDASFSFKGNVDPILADIIPPPQSFRTSGVVGGLQLGYNWQLQSNWLLGFETDFDWSGMRGSSTVVHDFRGSPFLPFASTVDEHVKWFGTVRGRVGWLPWSNLLIYGTGGFADGRVDHTASLSGSFSRRGSNADFRCPNVTTPCFAGSSGNVLTGWTAGGGVEYALWQQWSLKLEYLYVSLASKGLTETAGSVNMPASFNTNFSRTNFNVVRVGLNYQFH